MSTPAVLWGTMGPDSHSIDTALDAAVGKKQSLVHLAIPWKNSAGLTAFPQAMLTAAINYGAVPLLDWVPWNLSNKADATMTLDTILAGSQDAYIHTWAQACAAWGWGLIIRDLIEQNGDWEPYGNQPAKAVAAHKRIAGIFKAEGANNVAWHWCPNNCAPAGTPWPTSTDKLIQYWDPDNYQYTGFDGYNFGDNEGVWKTFKQVLSGLPGWLGDTYGTIASIAPTKPMIIGEFGCNAFTGDKAGWITQCLSDILNKYPLIRGISYFNWDPDATWDLFTPSTATAAWKAGIADPRYVAAGTFTMTKGKAPVPLNLFGPMPDVPANYVAAGATDWPSALAIADAATATAQAQVSAANARLLNLKAKLTTDIANG